ncbi:hypothetical protein GCM10011452_04720 [Gemmobacter lanyuensis]|uniref:Uncharacterized protein n=1 Tax=Gemmobacter lanyuensis TaxID=1054497 RepID=A0A918ILP9_9RHOB|nr:hypothetical protein GCM10011452_04720 [Gemmobacter lanyuensis]
MGAFMAAPRGLDMKKARGTHALPGNLQISEETGRTVRQKRPLTARTDPAARHSPAAPGRPLRPPDPALNPAFSEIALHPRKPRFLRQPYPPHQGAGCPPVI